MRYIYITSIPHLLLLLHPEESVSSLDAHISHAVAERFSEHLVMSPKTIVDIGVGEYEWHEPEIEV
jgi:hypothetical protein